MSRNLLFGVLAGLFIGFLSMEYLTAETIQGFDYSTYRVAEVRQDVIGLKLRRAGRTWSFQGFKELWRNGITEYEYNKTKLNDEYSCQNIWKQTRAMGVIFDRRLRCHAKLKPRTFAGRFFYLTPQLFAATVAFFD